MLNLSQRLKLPPQYKSHPLQQMTRQLDMPNIRRVILGVDIIMLQDPLGFKVIHEPALSEMLMHILGFFLVDCRWEVGHA